MTNDTGKSLWVNPYLEVLLNYFSRGKNFVSMRQWLLAVEYRGPIAVTRKKAHAHKPISPVATHHDSASLIYRKMLHPE